MARSFIKMSLAMKNVSTLPRYFTTARVCYCKDQLQANIDLRIKVNTARDLFAVLQSHDDPVNLLSNLEINKNLVESRHIVRAFTIMHEYYQSRSVSLVDIQSNEHFKKMCSIIHRNIRTFSTPEILQTLKILNLIKVPSSTVIFQSLLQLIRDSINTLTLDEIFYTVYLMNVMEPSNLSRAILLALPEVFKAQYHLQLDKEDIKEIRNALRFASDYVQDEEVVEYLVDAIDNFVGYIDVESALSILWSLSNIKNLPSNYLNILPRVNEIIVENIHLLKPREVMKTLWQLSRNTKAGIEGFYEPLLIDKLTNKIVSDDYGFEKAVQAISNLNDMKHINLKLLNYASSICSSNEKILSECNILSLLTFITALANAHHKPQHWSSLKNLFIANHTRIMYADSTNLCYYALNLASLDCFDSQILAKAFSFELNLGLITDIHKRYLKKLYYCVKVLNPKYSGPWPSEKLEKSFDNVMIPDNYKPNEYPLLPALQKILGGPMYIKTNLETKEGFYIDHLIIFKNKNPIEFETLESVEDSKSVTYVENLKIPAELNRVAILLLQPNVYSKNIKILNAQVLLNIKILKALSYEVIHIPLETLMTMPDYEILPYLQNLLNTAKENFKDNSRKVDKIYV